VSRSGPARPPPVASPPPSRARPRREPASVASGRGARGRRIASVSRRNQIRLAPDEALDFLREQRIVVCATNGRRGWPHLMPLWYVLRETGPGGAPEVWSWTYAKSQKVRNIERDPRATLQVEAGEQYHELRGVMLECEVVVHRDTAAVAELGLEIFTRYGADGAPADAVREMVSRQAAKRVGLQFVERDRATWDHRKLGGVY
jgi:general stress protein 26